MAATKALTIIAVLLVLLVGLLLTVLVRHWGKALVSGTR